MEIYDNFWHIWPAVLIYSEDKDLKVHYKSHSSVPNAKYFKRSHREVCENAEYYSLKTVPIMSVEGWTLHTLSKRHFHDAAETTSQTSQRSQWRHDNNNDRMFFFH